MLLNQIGITVHQFQVDEGHIYKEDYFENIDKYVFTLDEWFEKNKFKL
jgi:hypothetical protein